MDESKNSEGQVDTANELGRYRLIAELARGGMGVVYLALVRGPAGFNKLFVVKELKTHLVEDASVVQMFLEEARLSAKLNHPNVVQTIEVGSDGPRHFIAMEYLDGQAFHRILSRTSRSDGPRLPLEHHLYILSGMLEGLQYAHDLADFDGTPLGIVHRDVSPHNLFVGYDGQIKLLDFGIAKALDSANDTSTGIIKGKIRYMAPEQVSPHQGDRRADRRADVFAAGVMLWESVAGERMWDTSMIDLQILRDLSMGQLPSIRARRPDVDPDLARIVEKATAVRPDERYATAAELQIDLDDYRARMPVARVGAREVGKVVSDLFAKERSKLKGVIDEQLRVVRGVSTGQYGKIDLPRISSASLGGTPATGSASLPGSMSGTSGSAVTSGSTRSVSVSASAPPRPPRSGLVPAAGVGVAAGVLAVALLFVALRRSPAPPADFTSAAQPGSYQPVAATAPPPSSTPPPGHATPSPAAAASASAPVGAGDTATTSPRTGATAEPRRGYAPGAARNVRHTSAEPVTPPSAVPAGASPPQPGPAAGAAPRSRQQIDTTNPYAQ